MAGSDAYCRFRRSRNQVPVTMPDWMLQLGSAVIGGGSVYAAIRSDLAALAARMVNVEKMTDSAHERIDSLWRKNNG